MTTVSRAGEGPVSLEGIRLDEELVLNTGKRVKPSRGSSPWPSVMPGHLSLTKPERGLLKWVSMARFFNLVEKSMEINVKDIIAKQLPAEVGKILGDELKELERLRVNSKRDDENITRLVDMCETHEKRRIELSETIKDLKKQLGDIEERKEVLDNLEKDLNHQQNTLDNRNLEYMLHAEREKSQFCQDVALGLVRNTEYRKTLSKETVFAQATRDEWGNEQSPADVRITENTEDNTAT